MRRLVAWTREAPGKALAIYWATAFIATHIPSPWKRGEAPPRQLPLDKIGHFVGYALLAWLLMNLLRRRLSPLASVGLTLLVCASYGAIDELTQPFVNRTADWPDYAADLAGGALGALLGCWLPVRDRKSPPR